jgi:NADPH:quinone reductase-like Zn-dependent oxidoreductase
MKAMVYHQYGPPGKLQLQEIEKPVVKDDELRVKVHSASVNWLDWHFLMGTPFLARLMAGGLFKPKNGILGVDLAGTVETVGSNITHFQSGEQVFGGSGNGGTFAEYVCVREDEV